MQQPLSSPFNAAQRRFQWAMRLSLAVKLGAVAALLLILKALGVL